MITALICAALVAAVVLVDVKPWRRPPMLTVTITANASAYEDAIRFAQEVLEVEMAPWQKRVLHEIYESPPGAVRFVAVRPRGSR